MKIGVNASQAYPSHLWPRGAYATAVGGAQSLANLSSAKLTPTEGKVRPDARVALIRLRFGLSGRPATPSRARLKRSAPTSGASRSGMETTMPALRDRATSTQKR